MRTCDGCKTTKEKTPGQWWELNNYHGIRGFLCPSCVDMVTHDDGKPRNPAAYTFFLLKQGATK
jgi:hypothetical protein